MPRCEPETVSWTNSGSRPVVSFEYTAIPTLDHEAPMVFENIRLENQQAGEGKSPWLASRRRVPIGQIEVPAR